MSRYQENCEGNYQENCESKGNGSNNGFALVIVLFILLIIIGASFMNY